MTEQVEKEKNKQKAIIKRKFPVRTNKNVKKVPFVEFLDNKLQGVVSSGSDINRVYVCVINFEEKTFTCHTNNNRPCGGLRGTMCSHLSTIQKMGSNILEFTNVYGNSENFYSFNADGSRRYSQVFTRFQDKLKLLELEIEKQECFPEMRWFIGDL